MAFASMGPGGVGSSRTVNGFKGSSSSVDWLGREMLEMKLRDKVEQDDERVSCYILLINFRSFELLPDLFMCSADLMIDCQISSIFY